MKQGIAKALSASIGKKLIVALSGLALIGFLIGHLAGNLTLYAEAFSSTSAEGTAFNAYAHGLEELGPLLLVVEVGLLALFALHIATAVRVSAENREARPSRYVVRTDRGQKTLGSSSMLITGGLVLVFLIVHLLDFRFASWFGKDFEADPAALVAATLSQPLHALVYLAGLAVLTIHLSHAFQSSLQTLGLHHPRLVRPVRVLGLVLALALGLGFASMPIYFLFFWGGGASS